MYDCTVAARGDFRRFSLGGETVKGTIVYVFKIIMVLVASGILWMTVIGKLDSKRDADSSVTGGIIGSPTVFKEGVWEANEKACIRLFAKSTDTYGNGYEDRTQPIWNSAVSGAQLSDGLQLDRGGSLPYEYQ